MAGFQTGSSVVWQRVTPPGGDLREGLRNPQKVRRFFLDRSDWPLNQPGSAASQAQAVSRLCRPKTIFPGARSASIYQNYPFITRPVHDQINAIQNLLPTDILLVTWQVHMVTDEGGSAMRSDSRLVWRTHSRLPYGEIRRRQINFCITQVFTALVGRQSATQPPGSSRR